MAKFVRVAKVAEVAEGSGTGVEVAGRRIALFKVGGEICALADECTHVGGPLSEGFLHGEEVECPWHGARFNLRTGEVTRPPAADPVACYRVRVAGDEVEVEVE